MAKGNNQHSGEDSGDITPVARNKSARFKYEISDKHEAGLELTGTEVKSLRNGKASIAEAFVRPRNGQMYVIGMNIPPYEQGNRENHEPTRDRRLLLHKREIKSLSREVEQKGNTIVPLSLYFRNGYAKLQIALGHGKQTHDRRETIKRREAKRDIQRAVRRRR